MQICDEIAGAAGTGRTGASASAVLPPGGPRGSVGGAPASTLEEAPAQTGQRRRLLCVVLSYDDLLADMSGVVPLRGATLQLGRASSSDGDIGGRRWRLVFCQGGAGDELRIADRWLSGAHAALEQRDGTLSIGEGPVLLRDLGSRNGTFVNGRRITCEALQDGDLIEVGHTLLCFRDVPISGSGSSGGGGAGAAISALSDPRDGDPLPRLGPTRTVCPEVALLVRDLTRVAASRESVLLLAETGAGKEVAAALIHQLSGRPGPFVPVDCGAVPESLFESAFFGHQRGAFTGAAGAQTGYLQRAHHGTLFLDEVANLTPAAQAKLLRVLEDGRVTPLGADRALSIDTRFIAATNVDLLELAALAARGGGAPSFPSFRPDLVRRLAGYVGRIPPLRQRREDLGFLCAYLLREAGVRRASISSAAGRRLFTSPFHGNVRELRAVLRSAALLAGDGPIETAHLGVLTPSDVTESNGMVLISQDPLSDGAQQRGAQFIESAQRGGAQFVDSAQQRGAPFIESAHPRVGTRPPVGTEPPRRLTPAPLLPEPDTDGRRAPPGREEVDEALRLTSGNVVHAARRLSTHPRQLYRWIERYGLLLSSYRPDR